MTSVGTLRVRKRGRQFESNFLDTGSSRAKRKREAFARRQSVRDDQQDEGIPFVARRTDQCAWIFGEGGHTARCCGEPIEEGAQLQFCPEHLKRAFSKSSAAPHEVDAAGQPVRRRFRHIGKKLTRFHPEAAE